MSKDKRSTYYDAGGIELIRIIKAKLTKEQYFGFLIGNVLKYAGRMNFKTDDPKRDIEKIAIYVKLLSKEVE